MKNGEALKAIRKAKPIRDVLQFVSGRLNVTVTSSSLFSDINSDLPSADIIEYLYDISSSSSDDLRIVLPEDCDLEDAKRVYLNYISLDIKRNLREYRSTMIKIISFLIFGVGVLMLSYFLEGFQNRLIADTVNIIGGFAVWEAAEVFFFARSEKKREMLMKLRLVKAEWTK